jgi:hypothetical protein
LIPAILLNLPLLFVKSIRWKIFLDAQHLLLSVKEAVSIYLSSLYIGFITPGRLGEVVKALYLKQRNITSFSKGLSSTIIDRLLDLYLLILIASLGVYDLLKNHTTGFWFFLWLILILLSPLIIFHPKSFNLMTHFLFKKILPNKFKDKFDKSLSEFSQGISQIFRPGFFIGILLTIFSYSLFFLQCYLVAKSIGLQLSYFDLALIMSLVNLISFIPISISGLGTREASMVFLFKNIGLSAEVAVSYSLLVFFTSFICGGLIGFVAWLFNPLKFSFSKKERASL